MREGTKTAWRAKGGLDEGIVKEALAAVEAAEPDEEVQAGLEAVIAVAETDPAAARSALLALRADHARQGEIEAWLGGDPDRATFGLGAAIQLAEAELASPAPELQRLVPDLLHWLEGDW